eukprot:540688_1
MLQLLQQNPKKLLQYTILVLVMAGIGYNISVPVGFIPRDIEHAIVVTNKFSQTFWANHSFNNSEYVKILFGDIEQSEIKRDTRNGDIFTKCEGILNKTKGYKGGTNWIPKYGWSQARQDFIIYHTFFYGVTDGIYVDIGAHDPFYLSNTAFFDHCLGWKGICVEPLEKKKNEFLKYRSCQLAQHCVYSKTINLTMEFSSFQGVMSQIISENGENDNVFTCSGISALDLLNRYKSKNKYEVIDIGINKNIDLISIDIEGAEEEFLKCFPFDQYTVKVWVIETNKKGTQDKIDRILYHYGYIKYKYVDSITPILKLDSIYIKDPNLDAFQTPYIDDEGFNKVYSKC